MDTVKVEEPVGQQATAAAAGCRSAKAPGVTAVAREFLGDVFLLVQQWGLGVTGVTKLLRVMQVVPAKTRGCKVETVLLKRFLVSKAQRKVVLRVLFTEVRTTLRWTWDNLQWAHAAGMSKVPQVRRMDSHQLQRLLRAAHERHPAAFVDTMARVAAKFLVGPVVTGRP